jgi:hypothetical protein
MAELIQLNRRLLDSINKMLKAILVKPEAEWLSEEILINLVLRAN